MAELTGRDIPKSSALTTTRGRGGATKQEASQEAIEEVGSRSNATSM